MSDKTRWIKNAEITVESTVLLIDDPLPWRKAEGYPDMPVTIGGKYVVKELRGPHMRDEAVSVIGDEEGDFQRYVPYWCLAPVRD